MDLHFHCSSEETKEIKLELDRVGGVEDLLAWYNRAQQSNRKLLVNFGTSWCAPCKRLAPKLAQYEHQHTDQVKVLKVELDKEGEPLGELYHIRKFPVTVLFDPHTPFDQLPTVIGENLDAIVAMLK